MEFLRKLKNGRKYVHLRHIMLFHSKKKAITPWKQQKRYVLLYGDDSVAEKIVQKFARFKRGIYTYSLLLKYKKRYVLKFSSFILILILNLRHFYFESFIPRWIVYNNWNDNNSAVIIYNVDMTMMTYKNARIGIRFVIKH